MQSFCIKPARQPFINAKEKAEIAKMKEASRVQAVIEVLEEVWQDGKPADGILDRYFKERRYIGAKDRRFIADTAWRIIRNRMKIGEAFGGKLTARLAALYLS